MRYAAIVLLLLSAQQTASRPSFEAVRITRNVSHETTGGGAYITNGRLQMTNVTVNALMRAAYWAGIQLAPSQIVDGPSWVDSDGFDVTATVGPEFAGKNTSQMMPFRRQLLQSMLENRFRLSAHRETREVPHYVLTMARADGAFGPRLRRPVPECSPAKSECAVRVVPGHLSTGYAPLAALVNHLETSVLRTVVVDRTGLDGMLAIDFEWSPDASPAALSAALEQQLGLTLKPERNPVDVVVIDRIERPAED